MTSVWPSARPAAAVGWRIDGQQTTVYAKGVQDSTGTELRLITEDYTYKRKFRARG